MSSVSLDTATSRRCPECGSHVKRVLRNANDKRRWDADRWRRYRCRSAGCEWSGLLALPVRQRSRSRPGLSLRAAWRTGLVLLLVAGAAWAAVAALQLMTDV